MSEKKTTGLEDIPQFLKRPVYKDQVFWIGLATLAGWALFFYWLFS